MAINYINVKLTLLFAFLFTLAGCIDSAPNKLMLAIVNNDEAQVKELLKEGSDTEDIFIKKSRGHSVASRQYTALGLAMQVGNPNIINLLLDHGANISAINYAGMTPIDELFRHNDVKTIKKILNRVDRDVYSERLAIHIFYSLTDITFDNHKKLSVNESRLKISKRKERVAIYILDELANNNHISNAMILACEGMHHDGIPYEDIILRLLEYWKPDSSEALSACIRQRSMPALRSARLMLEHGDIVNKPFDITNITRQVYAHPSRREAHINSMKKWNGKTPLFFLPYNPYNKDVAHLLFEFNADPNIQDSNGKTALMDVLFSTPASDATKILLKNGAEPNILDNNGNNALSWLIRSSYLSNSDMSEEIKTNFRNLLELLRKYGVNDNYNNISGLNMLDRLDWNRISTDSLVMLVINIFPEIINTISAEKNELLSIDKRYLKNRLFQAAALGNYDVVKSLVDYGINVNGFTKPHMMPGPIYYAKKYGHKEIVSYLRSKGAIESDRKL